MRPNQRFGFFPESLVIYSQELTDQDILGFFREKLQGKQKDPSRPPQLNKLPRPLPMTVCTFGSPIDAKSASELCGSVLPNGSRFFLAPIDRNTWESIFDGLWPELENRVSENLLDFSNLGALNIPFQLSKIGQGSFAFFLAACYCQQNRVLSSIFYLDMSNNELTFYMFLDRIKSLFPALKAISLGGNPIDVSQQRFLANFEKNHIEIVFDTNDARFGKSSQENLQEIHQIESNVEWDGGDPVTIKKPLNVCVGILKPEVIVPSIEDYPNISLDPDRHPIYRFINDFLKASRHSIETISKYYFQTAVFSITVDVCATDSPLYRYRVINRNLMNEISRRMIATTAEAIGITHINVFSGSLIMALSDMTIKEMIRGLFAVTLSGVLQEPLGAILGFDRTLVIGRNDNKTLILNDHMYLRNPK